MALSFITPTHRLESGAAASYRRARKAKLPPGINSADRSTSKQKGLFLDNYTHVYADSAKFDRKVWNGVSYWRKRGNTVDVAPPGWSKHEKGLALDLPLPARAWMQAHGQRYGWFRTNDEPWHFEYQADRDRVRVQVGRVNSINKILGIRKWRASKERIKEAQKRLKAWSLYDGEIDGIPGPKTQKAWASLNAKAK